MFETRMVIAHGTEHAWRAVAVHLCPDPEEPWHIFLTFDDEDLWLTPIEMDEPPHEIVVPDEEKMARFCRLLGVTWKQVWDDPFEVIAAQYQVLDGMDTVEVTEGEKLRQRIVGIDPLVGRC